MNNLYFLQNKSNKILTKFVKSNEEIKLDNNIETFKIKYSKFNLIEIKFLFKNNTFYLINKEKWKGKICLNYIGFDYDKSCLKFSFFSKNSFFTIYSNDLKQFKKWKKIISKISIFNNIHKKFDINMKIGEIFNLKFYLANKKTNVLSKYLIILISKKNFLGPNNNFENILKLIKFIKMNKFFKSIYESNGSFYIILKICNSNNIDPFKLIDKTNLMAKIVKKEKDIFKSIYFIWNNNNHNKDNNLLKIYYKSIISFSIKFQIKTNN